MNIIIVTRLADVFVCVTDYDDASPGLPKSGSLFTPDSGDFHKKQRQTRRFQFHLKSLLISHNSISVVIVFLCYHFLHRSGRHSTSTDVSRDDVTSHLQQPFLSQFDDAASLNDSAKMTKTPTL